MKLAKLKINFTQYQFVSYGFILNFPLLTFQYAIKYEHHNSFAQILFHIKLILLIKILLIKLIRTLKKEIYIK